VLDWHGWINRPGVDEVDEVEVAISSLIGEKSLVSLACCESEMSNDGTGCEVGVGLGFGTGITLETYRTMVVH
jgi:hypothetical protein